MTRSRAGAGSGTAATERLARQLAASLTPDEIHEVLAASLLALSVPERKKMFEAVGRATAESVRRILERPPPRRGKDRVTTSAAHLAMEWTAAWEGWEGCVSDAADEHGPFVVHDPPWESPWFDGTAFSAALDATVSPIRRLWPRAVAADLVADIDVAETLVEGTREIASASPEWMSPPPTEDLTYGEPVTALLLDALDVRNRSEGRDAYGLVVAIRAVEDSLDPAGLDADAVMRFIGRLSPRDRAVVQKGIAGARTTPMWTLYLGMPRSHWFRSFQALNAELSPDLGLDLSRQNVASDWRLAGPVLDALRKRREHREIIELAARAVHSLLRLRDGEAWAPPDHSWRLFRRRDGPLPRRVIAAPRSASLFGGEKPRKRRGEQRTPRLLLSSASCSRGRSTGSPSSMRSRSIRRALPGQATNSSVSGVSSSCGRAPWARRKRRTTARPGWPCSSMQRGAGRPPVPHSGKG